MGKQFKYHKVLTLKKAGTGEENVDDDPVNPKVLLTLEDVAVEDETTALDYIRIGKVTSEGFFLWEEQKSPAAAELVFTSEEHKLRMGEHFRCKVKGGAANDVIHVYLEGYWQYWKE